MVRWDTRYLRLPHFSQADFLAMEPCLRRWPSKFLATELLGHQAHGAHFRIKAKIVWEQQNIHTDFRTSATRFLPIGSLLSVIRSRYPPPLSRRSRGGTRKTSRWVNHCGEKDKIDLRSRQPISMQPKKALWFQ